MNCASKWIDLHIDTLMFMVEEGTDPLASVLDHHVDVPRMRGSGVQSAVWAAWVKEEFSGNAATAKAVQMLDAGLDLISRSAGGCELIGSRADFDRVAASGNTGIILGIEGATPLQDSFELLSLFHQMGVRMITLTWNHSNHFGSGCRLGDTNDGGLTGAGEELIRRMESLGIILDLSHASPRTFDQALCCSQKPVTVSHANCRSLCDHRRNLTDQQLKQIAATGGVVGISICPHFLTTSPETADLEMVIDHIAYARDLIGDDAIALGTDFDGITSLPAGIAGVEDLNAIATALSDRGWDDDTIEKFACRNGARLIRDGLPAE